MTTSAGDLVVLRPQGLYCPAGDFYIDPWRPVDRAVVTHAHADHARAGHRALLAQVDSLGVLRERLGPRQPLQGLRYGETLTQRGVTISLHPAGHVLGSAQVRLEHAGRVWVASGDYFVSGAGDQGNATCAPFEPVRCDTFITESTFALPIYRWAAPAKLDAQINRWWAACAADGAHALLMGYSFGKAQRLLAALDPSIGPIFVHPTVDRINRAYRAAGVALPPYQVYAGDGPLAPGLRGAMLVAPPNVRGNGWAQALGGVRHAFASGWMQVRNRRQRMGMDRGFVVSDHADWPGLTRAIAATGASRVIVTHGYEDTLVRWLREQGLQAGTFRTAYGDAPGDEESVLADESATADPSTERELHGTKAEVVDADRNSQLPT